MEKVFVIAEAGVNHNGDEAMAVRLVELAASCGANAVKFQSFSADKLVARGTAKAGYQQRETGAGDQHSMLRALELSESAHQRLASVSEKLGIEFMSTPFDEEATDMLLGLGMKRIKIPSGEITNLPFLRFLAAKKVPLILSTGMADMSEIDAAIRTIREIWNVAGVVETPQLLTVLHCTSNYPAEFDDVNLRAMKTIGNAFDVPVGYSDHTLGISVSTAAVALGARVIEKHFTLDKNLPGPDHKASLDPTELAAFIQSIRSVERCLGSPEKCPTESELPIRALVRRSVTLLRNLPAGAVLQASDLALMRPGTGITPDELVNVSGRKIKRDLVSGTTLQWSDLE